MSGWQEPTSPGEDDESLPTVSSVSEMSEEELGLELQAAFNWAKIFFQSRISSREKSDHLAITQFEQDASRKAALGLVSAALRLVSCVSGASERGEEVFLNIVEVRSLTTSSGSASDVLLHSNLPWPLFLCASSSPKHSGQRACGLIKLLMQELLPGTLLQSGPEDFQDVQLDDQSHHQDEADALQSEENGASRGRLSVFKGGEEKIANAVQEEMREFLCCDQLPRFADIASVWWPSISTLSLLSLFSLLLTSDVSAARRAKATAAREHHPPLAMSTALQRCSFLCTSSSLFAMKEVMLTLVMTHAGVRRPFKGILLHGPPGRQNAHSDHTVIT
jgi:hypothetical protein